MEPEEAAQPERDNMLTLKKIIDKSFILIISINPDMLLSFCTWKHA